MLILKFYITIFHITSSRVPHHKKHLNNVYSINQRMNTRNENYQLATVLPKASFIL